MSRNNVIAYGANATWTKPPKLYAIELVIRGGGGGGASGVRHSVAANRWAGPGGGGGGAVHSQKRIRAEDIPDVVAVTVGPGGGPTAYAPAGDWGWIPGNHGGDSAFGEILHADGGLGGGWLLDLSDARAEVGGYGGFSVMRGGNGGTRLSPAGESVTSGVVSLLAGGGGGGAGGPSTGGVSGVGGKSGLSSGHLPVFWQTCQSGAGGVGGTTSNPTPGSGGFPAGGGGGGVGGGGPGLAGAAGCVTVIEYLYD